MNVIIILNKKRKVILLEKKKLQTYLIAPFVMSVFLGTGSVLADEQYVDSPLPETAVTEAQPSIQTEAADNSDRAVEIPEGVLPSESADVQEEPASNLTASTETEEAKDPVVQEGTAAANAEDETAVSINVEELQQLSESAEEASLRAASPDESQQELAAALETQMMSSAADAVLHTQTNQPQPVTLANITNKELAIAYQKPVASDERIMFAVWSDVNGQDDLVWYTADAAGAAYVDLSRHRSYGTYHIHTYSVRNSGNYGLDAMTVTVAEPQIETAIKQTGNGSFDIIISKVPQTITGIMVPVWSDQKGQDDLIWYTARQTQQGTYTVSVAVKNHNNDRGHYHANIYGYSTILGSQIGLASTSGFDNVDTRSNAAVSIANYAENKTTFDVVVAGSSTTKEIKAVNIAVWSQDKGQDDLKWYSPTVRNNRASATVNIANHSNRSDQYIVHVYTDYSDGTTVGTVLGSYKITKPAAKNTVTASLTSNGIAIKLDSNTVTDYSKVHFAVWSQDKGQDDLQWYQSSSSGTVTAPYSNHRGYGIYHIHAYLNDKGRMVGLSAKDFDIGQPNVKTAIAKATETSYTVTVSEIPAYISSIMLPVWTSHNGQDDLSWLTADRQANGTYTATINLRDHNFETGHYHVNVYGQSKIGNQFIGLSATEGFTVTETVRAADAAVAVTNHNAAAGRLEVVVTEKADGKIVKNVQVAAWSESNQANLAWYETTSVSNGKASVTVDAKNHGYIQGNYTVHAYINYNDGSTSGFDLGSYAFNAERPAVELPSYFIDISSHNGIISTAEFTSLKQQGIEGVVVKLTEGTSYTNPYARAQIANAQAAGIKVSAYHYSHYTTEAQARAEAQYFVSVAQSLGLSNATVMVNDMEESAMLPNINSNVQAWQNEMNRLGYNNVVHYTMASWLDIRGGQVSTSQFGLSNFWIAHYTNGYTYLSQEQAKALSYYSNAAAWQYTSVSPKLSHNLDENIDYTGRFTR
ncbi:autolysin [Streptococcus pantholopis]|uniref:Lysozyme n=2 Tax=Streptococcus pantholopis TaxID=1811193 RepID=A0A172Q6R9_9STRE|nr:GBS Bsp-like repeat-containing protein [Streptococcus pantholopis]AND79156.1 autolysin [Streptococcus pantholopis]